MFAIFRLLSTADDADGMQRNGGLSLLFERSTTGFG